MTWLWWFVLVGVLVACPIGAGICLRKAQETGEVDRLQEAIVDLEREIGAAFLPIVERASRQIERWGKSVR